jgi:hypothetical protein
VGGRVDVCRKALEELDELVSGVEYRAWEMYEKERKKP